MSVSTAPVPRRFHRPRWLDPRIIGGVVLVVVSVVIGAKVIAANSRTVPVWAAARSLAAGTVLVADDVVVQEVNLAEAGPRYLDTAVNPAGRVIVTQVGEGELLPASALGPQQDGRVVVVDVDPERMPPGVVHGSRIDLYLTTEVEGGRQTSEVAAGLTVQTVRQPASGGLSGVASDRYQISVTLAPPAAADLVRRLPTGDVTAVLITEVGR